MNLISAARGPWSLTSLKKEFHKETEIVKQAQHLLEAQYMWESTQRSSLLREEAKVTHLEKKSVGILASEECAMGAGSILNLSCEHLSETHGGMGVCQNLNADDIIMI